MGDDSGIERAPTRCWRAAWRRSEDVGVTADRAQLAVARSISQAGTQLYPGSIATPTPQTFGATTTPDSSGCGVGPLAKQGPRTASRPISTRLEPVPRLRGVNHWFACAVPSGLASRTRTIWQYWRVPTSSELLPTLPGVPRIRLLPASTQPLRQLGGEGLSPPLEHQAPRGALCVRSRCGPGCRGD